jgi:hypothetical protein
MQFMNVGMPPLTYTAPPEAADHQFHCNETT